jgi:hypothetical protein
MQGLLSTTGPISMNGNDIPTELNADLQRLGIMDTVKTLVDAVRQVYPDAEKIELSVFRDDCGDERVRVNAVVPDEGDVETAKYFRCLSQWTAAVAPEVADKIVFTTA